MGYPVQLRNSIVKRLLAKEIRIVEAVEEYGVSKQTLQRWVSTERQKAKTHGRGTPNDTEMTSKIPLPNNVSFTKMYNAYVLCQHFGFESSEAGKLCRQEGLMMEDVKNFAKAVAKHELTDPKEVAGLVTSRKKDKSKLKELESANRRAKSEIAKKDKVTAELTALLVLSKKAEAIWGDKEG